MILIHELDIFSCWSFAVYITSLLSLWKDCSYSSCRFSDEVPVLAFSAVALPPEADYKTRALVFPGLQPELNGISSWCGHTQARASACPTSFPGGPCWGSIQFLSQPPGDIVSLLPMCLVELHNRGEFFFADYDDAGSYASGWKIRCSWLVPWLATRCW